VSDPFYWCEEPWGPALRCAALDPAAVHCFTTRALALPDVSAVGRVASTMGVGRGHVVAAQQVHGRDVVVVRSGAAPASTGIRTKSGVFEADILVSDDPSRAVLIRVADCVPLLIADRRTGAVAAVHAGWRGTAAGAGTAAVEALGREWGSRPEDLVAAIGPAIGACCYEVGPDVVDAFAAAGHARHLIDRWFQARPPSRGASMPPSLRLDVPGANRDQLALAGVPDSQIHTAGLCTAMYLDVLTSYRAEGGASVRLAGVIRPRPVRDGEPPEDTAVHCVHGRP
jgi:YfiH family protein